MVSIQRITYEETKPFLLGIHYARRMPSISYAFGMFEDDELIGVCTFGSPASPSLCKGIAGEDNRRNVLELNRLCFKPEFNGGNRASQLVSYSLKQLPNHTFVVSYADWGGGITLDMFIKPQTGTFLEHQSQEQTSILKGIQDTMHLMKPEGLTAVQSIDISIW